MVVIIPDDKIRNIQLTGDEIGLVIEQLVNIPYIAYKDLRYDTIVRKLRNALNYTADAKGEDDEN